MWLSARQGDTSQEKADPAVSVMLPPEQNTTPCVALWPHSSGGWKSKSRALSEGLRKSLFCDCPQLRSDLQCPLTHGCASWIPAAAPRGFVPVHTAASQLPFFTRLPVRLQLGNWNSLITSYSQVLEARIPTYEFRETEFHLYQMAFQNIDKSSRILSPVNHASFTAVIPITKHPLNKTGSTNHT